jgi:quinoprotein dehydrogenase-associated probable ABC transporter substrate-binding protein
MSISHIRLRRAAFCVALAAFAGSSATAQQTSSAVDTTSLRVCADPAAMPFSNNKGEGFENKIAELIASKLNVPVQYEWYPMATGFVRNTLNAGKCDLIIGYAQGDELVQNTNAYYKSAWTLITRSGSGIADIKNLDDPRLKDKRIGIQAGAPPGSVMGANGLMSKARSYALVVDRRYASPQEKMIADLVAGEIDAAILWGPIGAYYAKASGADLAVIPLVAETKGPRMTYRITMGVRTRDQDWKRQLNRLLQQEQGEINKILLAYGVPLLDEQDRPITQ